MGREKILDSLFTISELSSVVNENALKPVSEKGYALYLEIEKIDPSFMPMDEDSVINKARELGLL